VEMPAVATAAVGEAPHPVMTIDGAESAAANGASPVGAAATAAPPPPTDPDLIPAKPTALTGHTILVGYGRVGSIVGRHLRGAAAPFLVVEDSDKRVAALREEGIEAVPGNAVSEDVLAMANPGAARTVVVAIPDAFEAGQVVQQARAANPSALIVARAHSDAEVEHLRNLGADTVIMGEREIARGRSAGRRVGT